MDENIIFEIDNLHKYSIQFDESIDNCNMAQIPFFIRGVNSNYEIKEYFLDLKQIYHFQCLIHKVKLVRKDIDFYNISDKIIKTNEELKQSGLKIDYLKNF